jgi:hypothetical protein
MRSPPPVHTCASPNTSAEACAPASTLLPRVPCGGVWGTVRVPPRGASTRSAPVGSAPQIGETADLGEVQTYVSVPNARPAGSLRGGARSDRHVLRSGEVSSYRMPAVISVAARGVCDVRGAARPAPAGGASPATPPGAWHPRDPRMCGQYQFARAEAYAVRCGARAGIGGRPLIMRHGGVAS